jgi:predicted Zn-dependent protease with MMP-like domain
MVTVSDSEFEAMVAEGIDAIPEEFAAKMDNIAVTWAEAPDFWQRTKLRLPPWRTLFGLYEGVPKTGRGNSYSLVLPDKITVFRGPLSHAAEDKSQLARMVKNTVWHEVGHHFGLSDAEIARRSSEA